jgi:hypothetical protein
LAFCINHLGEFRVKSRELSRYIEFSNDACHKTLKGEIKRGKQSKAFCVSD